MTDIIPRFFYRTIPGRCLLKGLVSPRVSNLAGKVLSSDISRRIVPWYINRYGIKMNDIEIPTDGFASFNEFFTRKRRETSLTGGKAGQVISPCDGMLSLAQIQEDSLFHIKGTTYSLRELLADEAVSAMMQGGVALMIRLMPQHYHRFCYSTDGIVIQSKKIEGKLHCVRPVALETVPVFIQNSREYQLIRTVQKKHMVHMEIGALLVGRINNYPIIDGIGRVLAGMEKGYFEFGGSTIILLFEKDMIRLNYELFEELEDGRERPVHMGQLLGTIKDNN